MPAYVYLGVAIVAEVVGTSALRASDGMTRLWPTVLLWAAYLVSFYLLSLALRTISVGVAYAIWGAAGMVLIALVGWTVFGERLDTWAVVGIGMIVGGVVVLNTLSSAAVH